MLSTGAVIRRRFLAGALWNARVSPAMPERFPKTAQLPPVEANSARSA
jgi:hypothetical protein